MLMMASTVTKVFCHYCGQGFKRDEHLERHILTHTNVRPFQCHECKLTFKRKDLLSRHYRSIHADADHDGMPSTSFNVTEKRPAMGRIPIACISCAENKTRCDKQDPCSRCSQKGIACQRRRVRRRSLKTKPTGQAPKPPVHVGQARCNPMESDLPPHGDDNNVGLSTSVFSERTIHQNKPRDLGVSAAVDDSSDVNPAISNDQSPDSSLAAYTDIFRAGTEQTLPDTAGKLYTIDYDLLNLPLVLDEDQAFMSDTLLQGADCLVPDLPGSWNSTLDSYNSWSNLQSNATFPKSKFADEEIGLYTTLAHLKILNNPNVWSSVVSSLDTLSVEVDDTRSEINETFNTTTRDWLLSVTQHIWRTVKQEAMHRAANELDPGMCSWMDKIILLPTTDILGRLFKRYLQNEQRRFSILPAPVGGLLTYTSKRNSVLHGLLGLLIIAKSIRVSENRKVQDLSNGLVGLCRIFNYNANWSTVTEHMELSLSLIQLMQWSGEGTHTNAVCEMWEHETQYIQQNILSHKKTRSDSFDVQIMPRPESGTESIDYEESRLLYSWVAVDLELSLLLDTPPKLSMQDCPNIRKFAVVSATTSQTSFLDLFEAFTDGCPPNDADITAPNLHLLLHPLQCVSARLHQCFHTFNGSKELGRNLSPTFGLASKALIGELEILLGRWQQLASSCMRTIDDTASIRVSMVIYHLIRINSHASFPAIVRLFQEHSLDDLMQNWSTHVRLWMRTVEIKSSALLGFHCVQCLQWLRKVPITARPLWWTTALYRISLILSMVIMARNAQTSPGFQTTKSVNRTSNMTAQVSVIPLDGDYDDGSATEHMLLQALMDRTHGSLSVTRSDGNSVVVDGPVDILNYCLDLVDQHILNEPTMLADEIRSKLHSLHSRWKEGL